MRTISFRQRPTLLLALCIVFGIVLGCTACGSGAGVSAASMHLRKTEGTVAVADDEGADIAPAENLGLYSGYTVGTEVESYAWIDLDSVKLTELNENSEVEIVKDGKSLSINIIYGSIFFNVTKPLAEDETMEIRTSSMLVGIRGTCGWMSNNSVSLLEGTVTVTAGEESVTISAGEQAFLTQDGTLEVRELTSLSIPAFVAREVLEDEALKQAVLEASGLSIPTNYEELVDTLEDVVYSEVLDFEADGSPELLVIQDGAASEGRFGFHIYRMGSEGTEHLAGGVPIGVTNSTRHTCSLVERDGRLFVCCRTEGTDSFGTGLLLETYYGSVAGQDGGGDWGMTDYFNVQGASGETVGDNSLRWVANHNEKGFVDDLNDKMDSGEVGAYLNQYAYTPVRELYVTTPGS